LCAGLLQEIEGVLVGEWRKLKIPPHLPYGERGIPGKIPPGAVIIAEIEFIAACDMGVRNE
jgi:FKBP-type peptidyl-prolyl cis-trans isomerase